jgi:hypothetical protein
MESENHDLQKAAAMVVQSFRRTRKKGEAFDYLIDNLERCALQPRERTFASRSDAAVGEAAQVIRFPA